jgi:hypothetical protein
MRREANTRNAFRLPRGVWAPESSMPMRWTYTSVCCRFGCASLAPDSLPISLQAAPRLP